MIRPSATDILCTECGLCCDGSLFSDVELCTAKEFSRLELLGVTTEEGDGDAAGLLLQPCGALKGKRCGIYDVRPNCCRTFECRLLKDVQSGRVKIASARETIAKVTREINQLRELIDDIEDQTELPLKEHYLEALSLIAEQRQSAVHTQRGTELRRRMRLLEMKIKTIFLG